MIFFPKNLFYMDLVVYMKYQYLQAADIGILDTLRQLGKLNMSQVKVSKCKKITRFLSPCYIAY